jgi:hypothetical protein
MKSNTLTIEDKPEESTPKTESGLKSKSANGTKEKKVKKVKTGRQ